jgi:hypothetical protein
MVIVTVIRSAYALGRLFERNAHTDLSAIQFCEKIGLLDATMRRYVLPWISLKLGRISQKSECFY